MILNEIKTALESVDAKVFYGMAGTLHDSDLWDYIVFFRDTMRPNRNRTGFTDTYRVVIVREEFIPDEDIKAVIDAVLAIDGMRLSESDFQYQYTKKPSTNTAIELLALDFVRPKKVS